MKITPVSINRNVNIIKNNNPKVTNPVQRGAQSTSYGAGNVFAGANISFGLFIKPKRKTNDELVYNQAEKLSNQEQTKNEQSPQIIIDKKGNTALHKANSKKCR